MLIIDIIYICGAMELRQLRYFVTVAGTLSFSKAAKALYITQGTLSQQIQQLESELGHELFVRTSHMVALTEAGQELLPLARQTVATADSCKEKMLDMNEGLSGSLNIGMTHSFARLVAPVIRKFSIQNPKVRMNVLYESATALHEMLQAGMLDLIIAFKPAARYDDVESKPFTESQLAVIMRKEHPLAVRKSLKFNDLQGYGIVLPGTGTQARKAFEKYINVDTSTLDVRIEMNDPMVILNLIEGTNMLSLMSTLAVHYNPRLTSVPLDGVDRTMHGCVHWLQSAYHKKAAVGFVEMLCENAGY